ncbi:hypothetical protein HY485_00725 [Candidatus Woesearchaeota archaeon]|nr:hypothetical protein [Candidatus Woesearchaeota archaeon]
MSPPIEQILTTASQPIVPYKEKLSPVNFDSECKEITRLISDAENRFVALYPLFGFLRGNKIPYVASAPFVYFYSHNGWCVSDNFTQFGLKITPQQNHHIVGVTDTIGRTERGFIYFDVGKEERSRRIIEESTGWLFKKEKLVDEKYLSDICLFKVRTSYELKSGPALENNWDVGDCAIHELAEVLTKCLYVSESKVRKAQAKFVLELFEKVPETLAKEIRTVIPRV